MGGEWEATTLGQQVELQRGIDITRIEQRAGSVPVISSGGPSSFHDTAYREGPGVVLGRKGVVGSVFFVNGPYWPHDTTLFIKDFKGNDPRFVFYFFMDFSGVLASLDVGSANPTLNRNHVHPQSVKWPPLREQVLIANLLGSLDDKIELNRHMSATLEEMARALFKSWFVDFDPVRAKAEGRDTGLPADTAALFPARFGENGLPKGWVREPLLEHARLISGGTPKTDEPAYWNGSLAWASAKDVSQCPDRFLISTERTITQRGLEESATRMVPAYATVVVARGATTGRHCLFGREMAMNQTCYALDSVSATPFWLACTFTQLVDKLVRSAHGSVFDTITTTTLQGAKVVHGSREVALAFETTVEPLYKRMLKLVEEATTLRDLRNTLLPKLISGQLRIKDAGNAVEAA